MRDYDVIILGAGVSGLSAALACQELGLHYVLIESSGHWGGFAKTRNVDHYRFDCGGHFIHSIGDNHLGDGQIPYLDGFLTVIKKADVYLNHASYACPIQTHEAFAKRAHCENIHDETEGLDVGFENAHGKTLAEVFFKAYHRKVFQKEYDFWHYKGLSAFMPNQDRELNTTEEYNRVFYYPPLGIGTWTDQMGEAVSSRIRFHSRVSLLSPHEVEINGNVSLWCENIISTLPLIHMPVMIKNTSLANVMKPLHQLSASGVVIVNLGIKKGVWPYRHWIYFPENRYPFFRIGCYSFVSLAMAPEDSISIYIELPFAEIYASMDDRHVIDTVWPYLKELEIVTDASVLEAYVVDKFKYVYPVQNTTRDRIIADLVEEADKHHIFFAGRLGKWQYSSMTQCVIESQNCVKAVLNI